MNFNKQNSGNVQQTFTNVWMVVVNWFLKHVASQCSDTATVPDLTSAFRRGWAPRRVAGPGGKLTYSAQVATLWVQDRMFSGKSNVEINIGQSQFPISQYYANDGVKNSLARKWWVYWKSFENHGNSEIADSWGQWGAKVCLNVKLLGQRTSSALCFTTPWFSSWYSCEACDSV